MRRLAGGAALAATVLHVAFLSLHVAMMAALAFSGDASASSTRLGFVICGPARKLASDVARVAASNELDGESSETPAQTATFCPICAGTVSPLLALPGEGPSVPAYVAIDVAPFVSTESPAPAERHEARQKRSRAPPTLA